MNKTSLLWELREARLLLDSLIVKIDAKSSVDDDEDFAISIDIEHILNHICSGWHYRKLPIEKVHSISQDEYERYATSVPNFGFNLKLLDGLDIDPKLRNES